MPTEALQSGYSVRVLDAVAVGVQNSSVYAAPARTCLVTWQISYGSAPASVTMLLQGSIDGVNYNTLLSSTNTAGDMASVETSVKFFRVRMNAVSGGTTVTVDLIQRPVG